MQVKQKRQKLHPSYEAKQLVHASLQELKMKIKDDTMLYIMRAFHTFEGVGFQDNEAEGRYECVSLSYNCTAMTS